MWQNLKQFQIFLSLLYFCEVGVYIKTKLGNLRIDDIWTSLFFHPVTSLETPVLCDHNIGSYLRARRNFA